MGDDYSAWNGMGDKAAMLKRKVGEAFDDASTRADRRNEVFRPEPAPIAQAAALAPNQGSRLTPEQAEEAFRVHMMQQEQLNQQAAQQAYENQQAEILNQGYTRRGGR